MEKKITIFHAKVANDLIKNKNVDLVGFHGQTIYHNSNEKISNQLGDPKLLSQLTKKNIIYNFRNNDINNGGEGAPLTPIFHQLIASKHRMNLPICILNIGGISNLTLIKEPTGSFNFLSRDIGPGNCLIDTWVRKNSKFKFDKDGSLASKGIKNEIIIEQAQELFSNSINKGNLSFDVNDFDVSFARGLSLEDGASTLTDFTARILGSSLSSILSNKDDYPLKILLCGGGRKNKELIKRIKENINKKIDLINIDDYGIDGDYIESQAFAFLSIRTIMKLPISFPSTTGCTTPTNGGEIIIY